MSTPSIPDPNAPLRGVGGAQAPSNPSQSKTSAESRANAARFQALLESLDQRSTQLSQEADSVDAPASLSEGVRNARASLEEALGVSEELLEALRQQRIQGAEPQKPEDAA